MPTKVRDCYSNLVKISTLELSVLLRLSEKDGDGCTAPGNNASAVCRLAISISRKNTTAVERALVAAAIQQR